MHEVTFNYEDFKARKLHFMELLVDRKSFNNDAHIGGERELGFKMPKKMWTSLINQAPLRFLKYGLDLLLT